VLAGLLALCAPSANGDVQLAETTPLVAQGRGRRLRGLVVSPLRAEIVHTGNPHLTVSPFQVRSAHGNGWPFKGSKRSRGRTISMPGALPARQARGRRTGSPRTRVDSCSPSASPNPRALRRKTVAAGRFRARHALIPVCNLYPSR
jgi:hypothetical protein